MLLTHDSKCHQLSHKLNRFDQYLLCLIILSNKRAHAWRLMLGRTQFMSSKFRMFHTESDGMQKANKIFSPKIMDFEYKRSYPNTFQRFMTKIRVNPIISIFRVNPLIPNFFFQHRRSIGSSFRPARKFGRFEG